MIEGAKMWLVSFVLKMSPTSKQNVVYMHTVEYYSALKKE